MAAMIFVPKFLIFHVFWNNLSPDGDVAFELLSLLWFFWQPTLKPLGGPAKPIAFPG
jgi:hypothetical protein